MYLATNGNMKYELEYHFPETVNSDLSAAEFDPVKQVNKPKHRFFIFLMLSMVVSKVCIYLLNTDFFCFRF